jgi:hypothetical protein
VFLVKDTESPSAVWSPHLSRSTVLRI